MQYLFDSWGNHIANFVGDQLHAPSGKNIGHFLKDEGFFIDMQGRYLGEIVEENRLMRRDGYPSMNWGAYGNYGNVGNFGNPGNFGNIGMVPGYSNLPAGFNS